MKKFIGKNIIWKALITAALSLVAFWYVYQSLPVPIEKRPGYSKELEKAVYKGIEPHEIRDYEREQGPNSDDWVKPEEKGPWEIEEWSEEGLE